MMTHPEVIKAFGGTKPLAEAIGVDPKLAVHWGRRGIPAKYWHRVVETAPPALVRLTIVDLERTKRPAVGAEMTKARAA